MADAKSIEINGIEINLKDAKARTDIETIKENQINLVEDDTSIEGISDSVHDTLTTANKKIIPAINEVSDKLKDIAKKKADIIYINVKDFGAKGDGVTDDTESIQNALSKNSNLYFPKGTYIVSKTIELTKSTNIKGISQIFNWSIDSSECSVLKGVHDDYIFKCSWGNQNNFCNINFDGLGIHSPSSSFLIECGFTGKIGIAYSRASTIDRCIFKSCSNSGIYKLVDSKILNSFFYSNEIGIYGYNSNDNIIQGNKIEWNGIGIKFDTNVYNLVQGNIFDRQTSYGIETVNGSQLSIKNNQFERNLINHIKINSSNFNIIGNSFFEKNSEDDGSGTLLPSDAIFLSSANKGLISNNVVIGKKMFSSTYSSVDNLTINNNTINGISDNPMWVNIGTVTVPNGETKELRYLWSNLKYLNANGYDVYVQNYRVVSGENSYYNMGADLKMTLHPNNGLYVNITNTTGTDTDFTIYVLLAHKQWNKR